MKLIEGMRIEKHNGRNIVCGGIFPETEILPNQLWQSSGGSTVTIVSKSYTEGKSGKTCWVKYMWTENCGVVFHEKDSFSFQCRYCLVVS